MDVCHGVEVRDPYRWLEDGDADEVRQWSEAQGPPHAGRARRDPLHGRHPRAAARRSSPSASSPRPSSAATATSISAGRAIRSSRSSTCGTAATARTASCSIPAALAEDRTSALDWYHPSDDGRLLAYGVSEGGSEKSVLRVRDVDTGRDLADVIPHTRACSLEWRPDGSGFFYTRYPEPGSVPAGEENYHRRVYDHVLGRDWREDPLVFGGDRPPEDWPSVHLSPDGRWLAVSVSRGWTRTDVYLRDLSSPGAGFVTVIEGVDAIFGVDLRNDRLYLQTNLDAPRSRLVAADLDRPGPESWRDVLPEGPDVLEGTALIGDWIVAVWLRDASSRVTLHARDGALLHEVALPVIGSVAGLTGEWDGARGLPRLHVLRRSPDRLPPGPARSGAWSSGRARRATSTPTASACASCTIPRATAPSSRCSSWTRATAPPTGTGPRSSPATAASTSATPPPSAAA